MESTGKITVLSFGAIPEPETTILEIGQAELQVTKRLPYEKIIEAIEWCVNSILDDRTFISAPLYQIIHDIAIIKFYTNLNTDDLLLGDFNLTNFYEWYDIIQHYAVAEKVRELIDPRQADFFDTVLDKTIHSLMEYRNSAAGIIDRLTSQNNKDNLEMNTIISRLATDDPELSNVKKLMEMFGNDPLTLATQAKENLQI